LAGLRFPSGDGFRSTLGSFRVPVLDYELYPIVSRVSRTVDMGELP
jgi:hypothetical protein